MRPMKIISGGQTGADQGALVAAKQLGIPTGGYMPEGFLTEAGPMPELAELYGMRQSKWPSYPARTKQNARESDGTVWIGGMSGDGPGRQATRKACDANEKPYIENPTAEELRTFVATWNIKVLNVAGPRGSKDSRAHQRAADLIIAAFSE